MSSARTAAGYRERTSAEIVDNFRRRLATRRAFRKLALIAQQGIDATTSAEDARAVRAAVELVAAMEKTAEGDLAAAQALDDATR